MSLGPNPKDLQEVLPPSMRIASARQFARMRMPYFSAAISKLIPTEAPGIGTMAVTKHGHLLYDNDFLAKLTTQEAGGVFLHEYMHIFLNHAGRYEKLVAIGALSRSPLHQHLSNIAADAEINDDLLSAGVILPDSVVTPQVLGLEPHKTYEYYVSELLNKPETSHPLKNFCGCGSGAGGEKLDEETDGKISEEQELDQHIARVEAARDMKRSSVFGKHSKNIQLYVQGLLPKSVVDWRKKLATSVRRSITERSGAVDYTFQRRNRYAPDDFFFPDLYMPLAEVAFVQDTSGSMGGYEGKVLAEANSILKALGGAKISYIACDAQVHVARRLSSLEDLTKLMIGGGGTSFVPAFEAVEKLKPRPDVMIFATDGYGTYPVKPPNGLHVIWLCISGSIGVDWGETIEVDA